ncbi:MAG: helix-turn-helix transcriptional regulator [Nitrospirota bacterium]
MATSPLLHEGLVLVLREEPTLVVSADMATCRELADETWPTHPDVVVIHVPTSPTPAAWREMMMVGLRAKVMLIVRQHDAGLMKRALQLGINGVLTEGVCREVIVNAIHEVISGAIWCEAGPLVGSHDGTAPMPSKREGEVMALILDGMSNRDIADRLCISERTVKSHVNRLLQKFRVKNRVQLALHVEEVRPDTPVTRHPIQ